ncbi:MAG: hypothetical protein AB7F50_03145 [Fimbriimonadaceae bacterium]
MKRIATRITTLFAASLLTGAAHAGNIYVMTSGNPAHDSSVVAALAALGHTPVVGVAFHEFDGTVPLTGYDAVFMQANYNWTAHEMPNLGQQQLVGYVQNGGGLVTSEWVLWLTASGYLQTIKEIFPSIETGSYNGDTQHTLTSVDPDPTINSGLPATFDVDGDSVAGGETNIPGVKSGALVFYATVRNGAFVGLSGWDYGNGRVAQFSQTVSERFVAHPYGFRLLGNVMEWVSRGAGVLQVNPTAVTVRLGRIEAGSVAQISDIDGNVFRVCKFIVPNQTVAPITVEVTGTSSVLAPTLLAFRTYGKMSVSGSFSQTLDMYDWTLNGFSPTAVTTSAIGNTYRAAGVGANVPVARFVSGSGQVVARYRIRQTGPAGSSIWCFDLDQAIWLARP